MKNRPTPHSDIAKKTVRFLTNYVDGLIIHEHEIKPAVELAMSLLENPIEGIDFMRNFPLAETCGILELAIESVSCGVDLPIVVPACPDYPESGYELGNGPSRTATMFLNRFSALEKFFLGYGIDVKTEIDIADVEILDPFLGRRLNLKQDEFFARISATQSAVEQEILSQGLVGKVSVCSMLGRFQDLGVDYPVRQQELSSRILSDYSSGQNRKVRLTLNALVKERIKIGDYQSLGLSSDSEHLEAAAYELAGYAAYGELIGSDALICSPDAQSAVPGYNFLKKDNSAISPTAFIKPSRREHGSLFAD